MADIAAGTLVVSNAATRTRVSTLLEQLKQDVPADQMTFGWLVEYLRARSPEVLILFLSLLGVLPGVSLPVGILMAMLSLGLMSVSTKQVLPRFIASQPLPSSRLLSAIERSMPLFQWGERYVRTRDQAVAEKLRPFAGLAIFLLSLTLLVPVPLSNVVPSLSIGLIAFACIEADIVLLAASLVATVLSLAITVATVWAAMGAARWMWS